MKKETMEKILSGEKRNFRIDGYDYEIDLRNEYVELNPRGERGSIASSLVSKQDYAYTHGGNVFCAAVDVAKEIEEAWRKKRAEEDDLSTHD
jgi:hypothetical protein